MLLKGTVTRNPLTAPCSPTQTALCLLLPLQHLPLKDSLCSQDHSFPPQQHKLSFLLLPGHHHDLPQLPSTEEQRRRGGATSEATRGTHPCGTFLSLNISLRCSAASQWGIRDSKSGAPRKIPIRGTCKGSCRTEDVVWLLTTGQVQEGEERQSPVEEQCDSPCRTPAQSCSVGLWEACSSLGLSGSRESLPGSVGESSEGLTACPHPQLSSCTAGSATSCFCTVLLVGKMCSLPIQAHPIPLPHLCIPCSSCAPGSLLKPFVVVWGSVSLAALSWEPCRLLKPFKLKTCPILGAAGTCLEGSPLQRQGHSLGWRLAPNNGNH